MNSALAPPPPQLLSSLPVVQLCMWMGEELNCGADEFTFLNTDIRGLNLALTEYGQLSGLQLFVIFL